MTVTQVIATAGHVDHGKSTLVRALTGMEPDRWEEERRRGLTIDLGFAWMNAAEELRIAFVDVPGHERFVPNMLAGLGPVPAVMMVVAADGGWMPQSAEHLAAISALGISRGLLVVTRAELAATSLAGSGAIAVSAVTGAGLPELRRALATLAGSLPVPDPAAPVRLWVDRAFSIRGSGTVVTGTLPGGTVRTGGELLLTPSLRPVRVRGIESLEQPAGRVSGVARVALNLRGVPREAPARGMALVEPGRWTLTGLIDVRAVGDGADQLPRELALHIGSARTPARVRVLGQSGGAVLARLTLRDQLPLHVGDRVLLRDPALRFEIFSGVSGVHYLADTGRELSAVYHLVSITHNRRIRLEVRAPDADPHIPSVTPVYPAANWHERETWDFFGIVFDGHPALTRIEMPDDWLGHPQRKDYPLGGVPVEYRGTKVPPPDERRSYT